MPICRCLVLTASLLLPLQPPAAARADECYYLLVFGAQGFPNCPERSHTFAVFVKACGLGPCPETYQIEAHTLSWMPATLKVRSLRCHPEPGVCLDLPTTLNWACAHKLRVTLWGPLAIDKELYDRACCRISELQSGALAYKVLDARLRPTLAVDCIHALSDVDTDRGLLHTGATFGDRASYLDLLHFGRWILDPHCTHDWVADRLGLGCCPIVHRGGIDATQCLQYLSRDCGDCPWACPP
jgi:hypothetical protein